MIQRFDTPDSRYADFSSPSSSMPHIGPHWSAILSPRVARTESMVLLNPVAKTTRSNLSSLPLDRTTLSLVKRSMNPGSTLILPLIICSHAPASLKGQFAH